MSRRSCGRPGRSSCITKLGDSLERFLHNFFNLEVIEKYLPAMIDGFFVTVHLAILIVVSGIVIGFALAVLRAFQIKPVNWFMVFWVYFFRAVPPLVILIIFYFAFPYIGIRLSGFVAVYISMSLVLAAFAEEIFWAGILSVDKGHWEAARSTGLGFAAALVNVVLPQAFRMTIPPLTNRAIAITKNTALASVVAVPEMLNQAVGAQSFSGNTTPLTMASIGYLIIFLPLVVLSRWIETRFAWKR